MATNKTTQAAKGNARKAPARSATSKGKAVKGASEPEVFDPPKNPKPKAAAGKAAQKPDVIDATAIEIEPAPDKKPIEAASAPAAAKEGPKADPTPAADRPLANNRAGRQFVGFVAGGILAAAIGYFAANYLNPWPNKADDTAALRAQYSASLGQLKKRVAALETRKPNPDPALFKARLDALKAAIDQENAAVAKRIATLDSRLNSALEQRAAKGAQTTPAASQTGAGTVPGADLATRYGAEIEALKQRVSAQAKAAATLAARIEAVSKVATQKLTTAQTKVAELSKAASEAVKSINLTQTRERLRAAVETGKSYAGLLAKLASEAAVDIPAALMSGADNGLVPLARLQQEFPAAARLALKASIRAQAANDGLGAKFLAFLKSQIGARSLTQKPGDGPDAVLSQAEAALNDGKLQAAVDLLRKLPAKGVAQMTDWLHAADTRLAAIAALKKFETSLGGGK